MSRLPLTLVTKDYDYVAPLACGDVVPEEVDLTFVRDTPGVIDRVLNDPSVDAGEVSLSRHCIGLANGDRRYVGIPIFIMRGFRHRCFYVRRDSGLRSLEDLAGRRVGTDMWLATGNTWSRAALRERGVDTGDVEWWVGPVDGAPSARPQGKLPANARFAPPGRTLSAVLRAGELDALMCPDPPEGFSEPDSPIVRLIPDYRRAEADYYRRTGIFPAHHIVRVRREVFERDPWVAGSLYDTVERSKRRWQAQRRALLDATPWLVAEIEDAAALIGDDWLPNGVRPNAGLIQTFCDEQLAQGLIEQPLDGATVFAEFEEVMRGHRR